MEHANEFQSTDVYYLTMEAEDASFVEYGLDRRIPNEHDNFRTARSDFPEYVNATMFNCFWELPQIVVWRATSDSVRKTALFNRDSNVFDAFTQLRARFSREWIAFFIFISSWSF